MPRKMPVIFTTKELELIVNLLKRHVQVAQYEWTSEPFQLAERLEKIYEIAKELEPIERI